MDAIYRAKEFGHLIEMDDFMKGVVYGYLNKEKTFLTISPQSIMLAKHARLEQQKKGYVTVVCPKCQKHPEITMTSKGERTIVSCYCGYIKNIEINF